MTIQLSRAISRFYAPTGMKRIARSRCKVLAIGAHPDDVEILGFLFAYLAMLCGARDFFGVTVANGASKTPRMPEHERYSTTRMTNMRYDEQQEAAFLGQYGGVWMLGYPSPSICYKVNKNLVRELYEILLETRPEILITHNPLDAHPTHISVLYHTYLAIQLLPQHLRPKTLYGGEGWADISRWFVFCGQDQEKIIEMFDCSDALSYLNKILKPYASQNGIMSYDEAVPDLLRTRARLMNPHRRTGCKGVQVFFDMKSLLDGSMTLEQYRDYLLNLHEDRLGKNYRGYKK